MQSTPGEGSTFRVALLLSSVHKDLYREEPAARRPPRGYVGPTRRVLVIDDEDSHRQLMHNLLRPIGFDVSTLANPLLAVEIFQQQPADLILLDLNMPGTDGWSLLGQLREHGCEAPVIVISADAADGGQMREPVQHQGYFIKPVQLGQLLDLTGRLLGLEWTYDAAAPEPTRLLHEPGTAVALPTFEHLRELLAIGHRKGLLEALYLLREHDAQRADLYNQLIALADAFQFEAIRQRLQVNDHEYP